MKQQRMFALLLSALLSLSTLAGCTASGDAGSADDLPAQEETGNDIVSFRPVDCGIQAQDVYEYPYIGLTVTLSELLRDKLESREVFLYQIEESTADAVRYAMMRFSATTEAQRSEEGMSVDLPEWEEGLAKVGVIGVYDTSLLEELDELTLCDSHRKIADLADGAYAIYLSVNSSADAALTDALNDSTITPGEMLPIDIENGYGAFSAARIEGLATVGTFSTEDIFGTVYDQTVFAGYDLTLVNIFATWCSPCVQEMPELEALRQDYAAQGIRLGVVAMVMDAKTERGIDTQVVEQAKRLYENSGAQFPFLLPDESMLNGRLLGIMAYPESFFVDSNGNIVSDPYVGANSAEGWSSVVASELAKVKGAGQ